MRKLTEPCARVCLAAQGLVVRASRAPELLPLMAPVIREVPRLLSLLPPLQFLTASLIARRPPSPVSTLLLQMSIPVGLLA